MMVSPIQTFQCRTCERWLGQRHCEMTLDFGDGTYADMCESCVTESEESHKFACPEAFLLYTVSMDGCADDSMGDCQYQGYYERFGRWILFQDGQGFVSCEEHGTIERAEKEWMRYYDDGAGSDEYDAYIDGSEVSFNGEYLGTYPTERRAMAAVSVAALANGYFPNLWIVSDHGNLVRRIYWPFHEEE